MNLTNWQILGKFLKERLNNPKKQPSYVFYFIIIIILIGSIGFFSELVMGLYNNQLIFENLTVNSANIFIALIAASSVELVLIREEELTYPFRKNDIQIMGVTFLIFGFLLWILSVYLKKEILGMIISLIGLILAYTLWWISNANNKKIAPSGQPKSTLGGDPNTLSGDTSDFKTE